MLCYVYPEAVAYSAPERTERDLPHSLKTKNTIVLTFPKYVCQKMIHYCYSDVVSTNLKKTHQNIKHQKLRISRWFRRFKWCGSTGMTL